MASLMENLDKIIGFVPLLRTILTVTALLLFFTYLIRATRKALLKKAVTKKQISNIQIFTKVMNYMIGVIIVFAGIFTYSGSFTSFGIWVGLMSAALGWALQRPITGTAGWLMIVIRRPFDIGDRIILAGVKGDVADITLTHIFIKEIGGIVGGEESSGRVIMVPNSIIFEQNIVNYTLQNQYVLDQASFTVTHDSDLNEAIKLSIESAKKVLGDVSIITKTKPYTRTYFNPSGINVHIRYFSPAQNLEEFSSNITREIWARIQKSKTVRFAYPHTEVLFKNKPLRS